MLAFLDMPGFSEILMIVFVALLVFGGKLPEVAKKMGKDLSKLKKGVDSFQEEIKREVSSGLEDEDKNNPTKNSGH